MRSDAPEQPELCPQELDNNGAEFDFEFEASEPEGNGAVITLANLPISGLLDRLPTENARTLLASCGVMSNLRKECRNKVKDLFHIIMSVVCLDNF